MKKRELTEQEKKRAAVVQEKIRGYEEQGYTKAELTVSQGCANVIGIAAALPPAALFVILWLCRNSFSADALRSVGKSLAFLAAYLLSFVVHEGIHGLCWGLAAQEHFKSIEFGITKDVYTPYCTCLTPLTKAAYCTGSLMPGIVLGVLPCVASIFTGEIYLLAFGCFCLLAAGGDFLIFFLLLTYKSEKKTSLCVDHPTEIGVIVVEK